MTKASDNAYPSILVLEGSAPSSPSAGNQRVYIDSADHLLKRKNSSGTVTTIEGSAGTTYGQTPAYPTSFTGNSDGMSATTNWVDVNAFSTKEILTSTILHLQGTGASQVGRVRYTLGTTRAAAFDFRFWGMTTSFFHWGADLDTYLEILGSTSGGTVIWIARILASTTLQGGYKKLRVGTTAVVTTTQTVMGAIGQPWNLQVTRDGSNVLNFRYANSTASPAFEWVLLGADNTHYAPTSSGTVARIEFAIIGPSGPSAGQHVNDVYIDAFEDAS